MGEKHNIPLLRQRGQIGAAAKATRLEVNRAAKETAAHKRLPDTAGEVAAKSAARMAGKASKQNARVMVGLGRAVARPRKAPDEAEDVSKAVLSKLKSGRY